jgi:hypothetical protein
MLPVRSINVLTDTLIGRPAPLAAQSAGWFTNQRKWDTQNSISIQEAWRRQMPTYSTFSENLSVAGIRFQPALRHKEKG